MEKLQVPYNLDPKILKVYDKYLDSISEIYFAPHHSYFPTARQFEAKSEEEHTQELCMVCNWAKINKKDAMLLLNGTNCSFENESLEKLACLIFTLSSVGLTGIVVANPILAHWIHNNFPNLKLRLSVLSNEDDFNKIVQIEKLGYISEICLSPRWIRDLEGLKRLKKETKLKYSLIINGMCRINCPLYCWHHSIFNSRTDWTSEKDFSQIRDTFLEQTNNFTRNLFKSPFILPSELIYYDSCVDFFKMEDRTMTTEALEREISYYSNRIDPIILQTILHGSCVPIPKSPIFTKDLKGTWTKRTRNCKGECHNCNYCDMLYKNVVTNNERKEGLNNEA